MRIWLIGLALLIATCIVGCGGSAASGGGKQGDLLVPDRFLTDLNAALQTRDSDFIGNYIAKNYLQDCQDKNQFRNQIMTTLGTTGTLAFTYSEPSDKHVNDGRGTADFIGAFTIAVTDGDTTRTLIREGRFHLQFESGYWRLYGNQECVQ